MNPSLRARVRAGDPDAFAELFDQCAPAVHRLAARGTGDWGQAEDIVSLTFLEAWRLRQRVHPDGDALLPWLLGICVNVLRNQSRALRRHRNALARVALHDTVPDFADEVVGRIADVEQLTAARSALDRLRRHEREVVMLCVWSGLDSAAAAEALGVSPGTVRSRLSRARTRLRAQTESELVRARRTTRYEGAAGQTQGAGRGAAARTTEETNR
ncbi:RNA polymerase sigma factor [Streptomyces bluensis]|uniref:RNA polymerase sigma factor n=1 Tax=Streptomyces bluensis TaxID=33897 RepID=UPI00167679E3|nr:sigma-70 family RNA polymerase sigma factor [Streptomyces bluensis]GGZ76762.1 siderophore-interacting protein [Streptomyces bluensis]